MPSPLLSEEMVGNGDITRASSNKLGILCFYLKATQMDISGNWSLLNVSWDLGIFFHCPLLTAASLANRKHIDLHVVIDTVGGITLLLMYRTTKGMTFVQRL